MIKNLSEMTLEELWQLFPIIIEKHNAEWKKWYKEESLSIINIIGKANIARISHIGNTAVKNLVAKPTIDILLEIKELVKFDEIKDVLTKNGWICMNESEFEIAFNKGYTIYGFAKKVYHLHVRNFGDHGELYFRDYLINHSDVANDYGKLKLSLKEKFEHDRNKYTLAKTEFIQKYTNLAKVEYINRYNDKR